MRQPSSQVLSPATAGPPVSLHPVLQAALENLDVQLEEELTRYRRQRRLQPSAPRRKLSTAMPRLAQDKTVHLPQFPVTSQSPATSQSPIAPSPEMSQSAAPPVPLPQPAPTAANSASASAVYEDALPVPASMPAIAQPSPSASSASSASQMTVLAAAGSGADALQASVAGTASEVALEPVVPEDYFASSEELLRSIAEEELEPSAEMQPNRLMDTLLTPLGIGSLLLLLLSTATLGYWVMNPTSFSFSTAQTQTQDSPAASVPSVRPGGSPAGAIDAPSPNLAAKEFVDINLNTISSLPKPSPATPPKPSPSPSPQAATKPLEPIVPPVIPDTSNLPPVVVPPQPTLSAPAPAADPRPAVSSPRRSTSPSPSAPVQSAPAVSPPADPAPEAVREPAPPAESRVPEVVANPAPRRSNYLVVTPYRSDSELNQVQQSVPDAYVRNFSDGASVQMGAFSDESKAEELVEELQRQGIQAEVRERE